MSPNRQRCRLEIPPASVGATGIAEVAPAHERVGSDPMVRIVATQPPQAAQFACEHNMCVCHVTFDVVLYA